MMRLFRILQIGFIFNFLVMENELVAVSDESQKRLAIERKKEDKKDTKHIDVQSDSDKHVKSLKEIRDDEKNDVSGKKEEKKDKSQKIIRTESDRKHKAVDSEKIKGSQKFNDLKKPGIDKMKKSDSRIKRNISKDNNGAKR